ncbi:MAG TPA: hypothetical protein VEC36_00240 [Patescibacteria group bacterium]|nr:hypothetical protein [Patescibacteria group bacterium]
MDLLSKTLGLLCLQGRTAGRRKYKVRCHIKTDGVSDNFQMFVPITVDFGKDRNARLRIPVKGKLVELDLSLEPEEIVFNDFHSVLATVQTERWQKI